MMDLNTFDSMDENSRLAWLNDSATKQNLDALHDEAGYGFETKGGEITSCFIEDTHTHDLATFTAD